MLASETERALKAAGWSDSRRLNVSRYAGMLETAGFPVLAKAADFLSEFGGLTLRFPGDQPSEQTRKEGWTWDDRRILQVYDPTDDEHTEAMLAKPEREWVG